MSRYDDIDPMDIDPETGRPYANYSSPSLDTSIHDHEMDVDDEESPESRIAALEHLLGEAREVIRKSGGGDAILNDIDEALQ